MNNMELIPKDHPSITYWEHTPATRLEMRESRIDDIRHANRSNNRYLKVAAFRGFNNLHKIGVY